MSDQSINSMPTIHINNSSAVDTNESNVRYIKEAVKGAVLGSFSENQSGAKLIGQTLTGLLPVVGQVADFRDSSAAVLKIKNGEKGGWRDLGLSAIGWVPGVGDYVKGMLKGRIVSKALGKLDSLKEAGKKLGQKLNKAVLTDTVDGVSTTNTVRNLNKGVSSIVDEEMKASSY